MVSRDWAIQRFHECIVGCPCCFCPARNLGLHAIRLMAAPICSGQRPSGIRPNPKAAVSAVPVAIAIVVKYPMRSAAIVISSITLPRFGMMPQNRRKAVPYVTPEIAGEMELFPAPQVAKQRWGLTSSRRSLSLKWMRVGRRDRGISRAFNTLSTPQSKASFSSNTNYLRV